MFAFLVTTVVLTLLYGSSGTISLPDSLNECGAPIESKKP